MNTQVANTPTPTGVTSNEQKDFPLCNVVYDLISVIHKKSQALEAYKAYEKDASGKTELVGLFKEICESDKKAIINLAEKLRCALNKEFEEKENKGSKQEPKMNIEGNKEEEENKERDNKEESEGKSSELASER